MNKDSKIFVTGHKGLIGSALMRLLERRGYLNIRVEDRASYDLSLQYDVHDLFMVQEPEYVFHLAAKVGGIIANRDCPGDFIGENLLIQTNVIDTCFRNGVKKLIFAGSGCVYPRDCPQPIKENYLLKGPLEKTNEAYAVAKIAGIKMCEYYRKQYGFDCLSVMPANVYGPGDNFSLDASHVVPGLMRKFHEARINNKESVEIWGSGTAYREFIYVDDLVEAMLFLMEGKTPDDLPHNIINIGSGEEKTIADLAVLVADAVGFKGKIFYDTSYPDGTPRKFLDSSRIKSMGWKPRTSLQQGLANTYAWFCENYEGLGR